ncbi:hypothetical protein AALP_AAs71925U000100 [Arabis alpina]|uniref:Uncharacterized protein n=1 Tax=Arabis alpina TaxID=50452 RepID=A0A087FWM4_ARAAL|nr:hypothetical protein AALP_AAs71925U000100 [Arabis alpina]
MAASPWISTLSSSTPNLRRLGTKLAHPRVVISPAPSNPPEPPVPPVPPDPPPLYTNSTPKLDRISHFLDWFDLAHRDLLLPLVSSNLFPPIGA